MNIKKKDEYKHIYKNKFGKIEPFLNAKCSGCNDIHFQGYYAILALTYFVDQVF